MRFNQLKRKLPNITHKMLSQQLKSLEENNLIVRKVYAEVPPKVEYSLTDQGKSLLPLLITLCEWATNHVASIQVEESED